jgi:isoquinoline 1-oxidoreductase beta subunit
MHVKDGRIVQENFHTYPVLKMDDMPKVETVVMPSGGFWGGVGEPTIAVAAPAVLNADLRRHRQAHPRPAAEDQNLKRA